MADGHCCQICKTGKVHELMDLGRQQVSHRYLQDPNGEEYRHKLTLGQCRECATVQFIERMPIEKVVARYGWLTCTEPEAHLDDLARTITRLPGITKDSKFCGVSFKDDSTLDRLKALGFGNTWRVDPAGELGITEPHASIESVQRYFCLEKAERMTERHGKADVLIARHIIEHAYDFCQFVEASKQMVCPGGYLVFEIPDSQRAFDHCDYTLIWEEHPIYFTGETFRNSFGQNGLSLVHFEKISYSIEDSYVGIAQIDGSGRPTRLSDKVLKSELASAENFAAEFLNTKTRFQKFLSDHKKEKGPIALFGGGHVSCIFLNLFELGDLVEFVVDDNPHMRGLFMPGSKLPIYESKMIYEKKIKMCISTLSASSEEKVIGKHQAFLEQGGEFVSVFPGSRWSMKIQGAREHEKSFR